MANENGARLRFRPAGSAARQHGAPEYGPLGTGCPAVEQAVTALYKAQNEESFWTLMNALNYALELDTRVLVPLQAAPDSEKGGASWAEHPVPAEKARDLPLWTLRTQKGKNYLPIFTSVKTAEADRGTAARPMAELLLVDAMQKVLDSKEMDGIVLDPWTTSATLDASLLNGLLHASRDTDEPGEEELHKGSQAALAGQWADALHYYEQAAEQGRAEALSMLGELLYEGKGVRRSAVQARRMWKKAAEAGDVLAMIALGDDCMASGKGPGAALGITVRRRRRPAPRRISPTCRRCGSGWPNTRHSTSPGPGRWPRWPRQSRGSKFSWARETPPRSSGCRRRKTPSAGCWATKSGKHSFFTFALRNCHTEPVR